MFDIVEFKNTKFGRLKPIEFMLTDEKRRTFWRFQCDCGNTKIIDLADVKRGKIKSCGTCYYGAKDLTNQKFNKLMCLTQLTKDKRERIIWRCECDCGEIIELPGCDVSSGRTKSCGCLRRSDIIGKRFGSFSVLAFSGINKHKQTLWLCACDCGNQGLKRLKELNECKLSKSCRCLTSEDLTGQIFGKLTVKCRLTGNKWICLCSCGNERNFTSHALLKRNVASCGCIRVGYVTHGLRSHPLYDRWRGMILRCDRPEIEHYKNYGAKGIKVCNEWLDSYTGLQSFIFWAETKYPNIKDLLNQGYELDRENPYGDYEPSNCRFITKIDNQNNRKACIKYEAFGKSQTISQHLRDLKINYILISTVKSRLFYGWNIEKALTTPPKYKTLKT